MNRVTFGQRPVPLLLVFLFISAGEFLAGSRPSLAAARADCVTAYVGAPFRLPNGVLYPAGVLTLCDYGTFSPVDNLHRITVSGTNVGLFRSWKRNAETSSMPAPEVVFNRDTEGNLELIGYAMPTSGRVLAYRMKPQAEALLASSRRQLGGSTGPLAAIVAADRGR